MDLSWCLAEMKNNEISLHCVSFHTVDLSWCLAEMNKTMKCLCTAISFNFISCSGSFMVSSSHGADQGRALLVLGVVLFYPHKSAALGFPGTAASLGVARQAGEVARLIQKREERLLGSEV